LVCRMKWVPVFALLGTITFSLSALPQTSTASKKKPAAKTVASKTHKAVKRSRTRRPAAPSYQLHPDPERYQQIQQALADRGYFKGQVNGEWGDDSADAMKRFQADQKLEPDGKINALSLIGLGLGPKHEAAAAAPASSSQHATDSTQPAPVAAHPAPSTSPANTDPPK
jgi:peptidoglycan hydrolase-like protein with peptidoglycan-binding domain